MGHGPNSYDTRDMKKKKKYCPAGRQEAASYYAKKRELQKRMRREEGMWLKTYVCGQKERELV